MLQREVKDIDVLSRKRHTITEISKINLKQCHVKHTSFNRYFKHMCGRIISTDINILVFLHENFQQSLMLCNTSENLV